MAIIGTRRQSNIHWTRKQTALATEWERRASDLRAELTEQTRREQQASSDRSHLLAQIATLSQSNAGLPHLVGDRFVYDASADDVVAHALRLRELGVEIIGACCGSTPEYVAAIKSGLAPN